MNALGNHATTTTFLPASSESACTFPSEPWSEKGGAVSPRASAGLAGATAEAAAADTAALDAAGAVVDAEACAEGAGPLGLHATSMNATTAGAVYLLTVRILARWMRRGRAEGGCIGSYRETRSALAPTGFSLTRSWVPPDARVDAEGGR